MTNAVTPSFSASAINEILEQHYGLSGQLKDLPSYCDQNFKLSQSDGTQCLVKVSYTGEPLTAVEMQNAAMQRLAEHGIPVAHVLQNQQGERITVINDHDQQQTFFLRVFSYLEGHFYADSKGENHQQALWHSLGETIANVVNALEDFEHVGAMRQLDWDLSHGLRVCQQKKQHLQGEQLTLVDAHLHRYRQQALPLIANLPQGVIHNDANDHNLLIDNVSQPEKITGLIDFGDMVFSEVVNELAIACAYAMMHQDDPIKVLLTVVDAYHQNRPLSDDEQKVLLSLVCLRLCVSVCSSAKAIKEAPDNEYLLVSAKPAWRLLNQLHKENGYAVYAQIKRVCHSDIDHGRDKEAILAYRQQHLSKNLSVNYQQPLKIVRGQGAYLYDEQGRAYLDMVNNVCHVGHCHPKVVAAGQTQMAMLNTNTRFLHDNIIDFAENLLSTMPAPLSVVMFVNSGSEANELAFRLARNYTKSRELMVVDGAYHGNTNACIDASPYKFNGKGGEGQKSHVHIVDLPDPYRGTFKGNSADTARQYANSVEKCIANIEAQDKKVGAFICESLQGVAGQIIMPDGYLSQVYQLVRDAGGVCIADEVQVGFGRVGTHMWAFETQGVVPDIVTLGKPIGNGHPLAAVVTTPEIADAFVNGMEYFNTFGGNPVSCAIGNAVLNVVKQESLQQNALEVGQYMRNELERLQQEFDIIGDVRGLGLFNGVEMVTDRETLAPATEQTAWLVEFMKDKGVLLSTEGRFYNILKIKPPIVFDKQDTDLFISVLRDGLTQMPAF